MLVLLCSVLFLFSLCLSGSLSGLLCVVAFDVCSSCLDVRVRCGWCFWWVYLIRVIVLGFVVGFLVSWFGLWLLLYAASSLFGCCVD